MNAIINLKVRFNSHPKINGIQDGVTQNGVVIAAHFDETNYPQWKLLVKAEDSKLYIVSHADVTIID